MFDINQYEIRPCYVYTSYLNVFDFTSALTAHLNIKRNVLRSMRTTMRINHITYLIFYIFVCFYLYISFTSAHSNIKRNFNVEHPVIFVPFIILILRSMQTIMRSNHITYFSLILCISYSNISAFFYITSISSKSSLKHEEKLQYRTSSHFSPLFMNRILRSMQTIMKSGHVTYFILYTSYSNISTFFHIVSISSNTKEKLQYRTSIFPVFMTRILHLNTMKSNRVTYFILYTSCSNISTFFHIVSISFSIEYLIIFPPLYDSNPAFNANHYEIRPCYVFHTLYTIFEYISLLFSRHIIKSVLTRKETLISNV